MLTTPPPHDPVSCLFNLSLLTHNIEFIMYFFIGSVHFSHPRKDVISFDNWSILGSLLGYFVDFI